MQKNFIVSKSWFFVFCIVLLPQSLHIFLLLVYKNHMHIAVTLLCEVNFKMIAIYGIPVVYQSKNILKYYAEIFWESYIYSDKLNLHCMNVFFSSSLKHVYHLCSIVRWNLLSKNEMHFLLVRKFIASTPN